MDPTWTILGILLVGVVTVIGGILVLRLHAFLALILAALLVAALTPADFVRRHAVRRAALPIVEIQPERDRVILQLEAGQRVQPGMLVLVLRPDSGDEPFRQIARLEILETTESRVDGKIVRRATAEVLSQSASLSPEDVAILPSQDDSATALSRQNIGQRVAEAFGATAAEIGILIAMAAIIGKCLLDSGAADRVVRSALKLTGQNGAPAAFLSSGFLLGIPVFFDTVFYLMIPLGKAMRMRTGRSYLFYVLTIVAGATMAHSLVPPTPGPLFVAEELGVDIGLMILGGCLVGLFTAGTGYLYAAVANRIWDLPVRPSPELSLEDLEEISRRDERDLPPIGLSLLPVLLPVILIGGNTLLQTLQADLPDQFLQVAVTLGDKNIALVLSAGIAMALLARQRRTSTYELAGSVQAALAGGGVIILITAAGGAFGEVLQQTGVAGLIRDLPRTSPVMICTLAFLITTAIRTAQGSATVAMITAVGILGGLAGSLAVHPVYLALAIGCGSKPIAWMNDSGFWVIAKMSGMSEAEALKYVTPMTALMGIVGLGVVLIGVTVMPLV